MERYELTQHALLEAHFPGHLIYGRWDWVFGCWLAQSRRGPLKEIVPTWPLFQLDGSAAYAAPRLYGRDFWEPTGARGGPAHVAPPIPDEHLFPQIAPGAVAALHCYLDLIPRDLRALVAPLGRYQWLFLDAVHRVPGFAAFIRREAETKRIGFAVAAWCAAAAHLMNPCQRRALARRIMTEPRRQLIESLLGKPLSPSAFSALYKFEPRKIRLPVIWKVIECAADPVLRQRLAISRKLSVPFLAILCRVPDWMVLPNVLEALNELATDEENIAAKLIPDAVLQLGKGQHENALRTLKTVKNGRELLAAMYRIEERAMARTPFPPPPISRHGLLVALESAKDLKREARAMRNCIASYTPAVLTGGCFLLAWQGPERGTVELVRDANGSWTLGSLAGEKSASLSITTVRAIVETLAEALSKGPRFAESSTKSAPEFDAPAAATGPTRLSPSS